MYYILNVHKLNPSFLNEMFTVKESERNLRDSSILILHRFNKIQYDKKTFSYYGAHLWNLLPNEMKTNVDFISFKGLLHAWEGATCSCNMCILWMHFCHFIGILFVQFNCFSHIIASVVMLYCSCCDFKATLNDKIAIFLGSSRSVTNL